MQSALRGKGCAIGEDKHVGKAKKHGCGDAWELLRLNRLRLYSWGFGIGEVQEYTSIIQSCSMALQRNDDQVEVRLSTECCFYPAGKCCGN